MTVQVKVKMIWPADVAITPPFLHRNCKPLLQGYCWVWLWQSNK